MAIAKAYNRGVDKNQILFTTFKLRQNNVFLDISAWQFNFILTSKAGAVIWNIINADFTRADIYSVSFQKSVSQLSAVADGNYTISLLVTNSDMTDNEFMNGIWEFNS